MALAEAMSQEVLDAPLERAVAREALARARQRTTPVVLAGARNLPVVDALAALLPDGLRRGSVVGVAGGPGATTLALALAVAASEAGSWTAIVGTPSLGLASILELGLAPERLLVVPEPPRESWATVVATLLDAVEIVVVSARRVAPGEARRLAARARERAVVLVTLPGSGWQGTDVHLSVTGSTWAGIDGGGAGRLVARRAEVVASGRGTYARERRAGLWLPGPEGRVVGSLA